MEVVALGLLIQCLSRVLLVSRLSVTVHRRVFKAEAQRSLLTYQFQLNLVEFARWMVLGDM